MNSLESPSAPKQPSSHRGAGMRILPGKASPAHTDSMRAHGDLECRLQTMPRFRLGRGPRTLQLPHPTNSSLPVPVGAVSGRHRNEAPQTSPERSLSPLTLTCISFTSTLQNQNAAGAAQQSHLRNTWMRAQQVLLEKQAKHFPCPFSPACSRTRCWTARDSTPGAPIFHRIPVASCTHLSMSPSPAQGAPVLHPPRWHETSAGASPPRPP